MQDPQSAVFEWDVVSLKLRAQLFEEDDLGGAIPVLDHGDQIQLLVTAGVDKDVTLHRWQDGTRDRRQIIAVQGASVVEAELAGDLIAETEERRTGQLQLLSPVGERRRAGRHFAQRADELAGELDLTTAKIDGLGLVELIGRAGKRLQEILDVPETDDESKVSSFHWSDPIAVDLGVLDKVDEELVTAGAWVAMALAWSARQRDRRRVAAADRQAHQEVDGVVLTDDEADDLAAPLAGSEPRRTETGPSAPDDQTVAVLEALKVAGSDGMSSKDVAASADVPAGKVRRILTELEGKGAVSVDRSGRTNVYRIFGLVEEDVLDIDEDEDGPKLQLVTGTDENPFALDDEALLDIEEEEEDAPA